MKDLGSLMKQAQAMQQKLQEAQVKLAQTEVEGASGGGLVRVTLRGGGDIVGLVIEESLITPGDGEIIADLIIAAHADAKRKLEAMRAEKMQALTGGLPLPPGLKLF